MDLASSHPRIISLPKDKPCLCHGENHSPGVLKQFSFCCLCPLYTLMVETKILSVARVGQKGLDMVSLCIFIS